VLPRLNLFHVCAKVKLQLKVSPEDGITKQEVDELKAALKKLGLNDKVDLSL